MKENNDMEEIEETNDIINNNNKNEEKKIIENYSKQKENNNENYKTLIKNEIKRRRSTQKFKIFKITNQTNNYIHWNNILLILCMIFYSTSIFLQFKIEKRFKIKKSIKTKFGFNNIQNKIYKSDSNVLSC